MGHGGEELTFGTVGRFGRLFGLLQFSLSPFSLSDIANNPAKPDRLIGWYGLPLRKSV